MKSEMTKASNRTKILAGAITLAIALYATLPSMAGGGGDAAGQPHGGAAGAEQSWRIAQEDTLDLVQGEAPVCSILKAAIGTKAAEVTTWTATSEGTGNKEASSRTAADSQDQAKGPGAGDRLHERTTGYGTDGARQRHAENGAADAGSEAGNHARPDAYPTQ